MTIRYLLCATLIALVMAMLAASLCLPSTAAQEAETIRSFGVDLDVKTDGSLTVTEDILYDFGTAEQHGIFREIPAEYRFDDDHDRVIDLSVISVDDGMEPVPYETSKEGPNLRIKAGDPNVLVSGLRRYRIIYVADGALNAFGDHDELFWNVTGDRWPVTIERVAAAVRLPGPSLQRVTCFQGPRRSTEACDSSVDGSSAAFSATTALRPGEGLTLVVALRKGAVSVAPPVLVSATDKEPQEVLADSFTWDLVEVVAAALVSIAVVTLLARQWWIAGRDRWYGDKYYFSDDARDEIKPLFSHETIVVEYRPPEIPGKGRRMRPAEVGLLLDERADTLDVSATIVDLAVRGYLRIEEIKKDGLFTNRDYELTMLRTPDDHLLPYERTLIRELLGAQLTVRLSDLKGQVMPNLSDVKSELYGEAVHENRFFPQDPGAVRGTYQLAGAGLAAAGTAAFIGLGLAFHFALPALPVAAGGLALLVMAPLMPRRTAFGREMYRRCLGFRLYLTTAEDDRMKFAEEINLFDEYLPYATVFGCAKKWAAAFEGVDTGANTSTWYAAADGYAPSAVAVDMRDFSTALSGVVTATAGGFGASGFGGGGFSGGAGGGVGGGGGGSW